MYVDEKAVEGRIIEEMRSFNKFAPDDTILFCDSSASKAHLCYTLMFESSYK